MPKAALIGTLCALIAILTVVATVGGIFSIGGEGAILFTSFRGEEVTLYGNGIYRDMPYEVAPQGIAQDFVSLFIAVPLMIVAFLWARRGSLRGRLMLLGVIGYLLLTYLFYLTMGMYNSFFLIYTALAGLTLHTFVITIIGINPDELKKQFSSRTPVKLLGGFLVLNSILIAQMWLGIVVPPLLKGELPQGLYHFTTLIVQGLDLAYFLPMAFVSGVLFMRKNRYGYLFAPIYFVFLSIMMLALVAKLAGMNMLGQETGLAPIIMISTINVLAIGSAITALLCLDAKNAVSVT